ncbi:cytochrome c assembly protein (plasmid) [Fulvitalea axinellae]|uniref:Cytochrome c assembly protein n=1 Tax=Fulvitalea axinellae TaxID=1182444 RepID=A0AAU9CTW5_9BACT|nr:cytochrome c assembly protein [Fulvitalea axinellae]
MTWETFPYFAGISSLLWLAGLGLVYASANHSKRKLAGEGFILAGIVLMTVFIAGFWINLDRPPLRTLGETRLWYAFFLPIIGWGTYRRWKYDWILAYSLGLAIMFLGINFLNPETHNKTLMPALRSPWFVPHVIVYIFAYAMLGASSIVAVRGLWKRGKSLELLPMADNLVYIGFAFLTLGLLFGALWAKEAWGHYWTWDPKETWAFLTWIAYLSYIHYRSHHPKKETAAMWTLALAFVVLLACWFGVNYMPSAQTSVHTYTQ